MIHLTTKRELEQRIDDLNKVTLELESKIARAEGELTELRELVKGLMARPGKKENPTMNQIFSEWLNGKD